MKHRTAECLLCKGKFKAFACAKESGLGICDPCWDRMKKERTTTKSNFRRPMGVNSDYHDDMERASQ